MWRSHSVDMNTDAFVRSNGFATRKSSAKDRRREILSRRFVQGFQSMDALASQFGISTQTIRRDVNSLCERGFCRWRHGS